MKAWLKGGLIGGGIAFVIFVIITAYILFIPSEEPGDLLGGLWVIGSLILIPVITLIGSLIGLITSWILKKNISSESKGWRIGLSIGLIFGIPISIPITIILESIIRSSLETLFLEIIILSFLIIISTLIGWVVGKIKSSK